MLNVEDVEITKIIIYDRNPRKNNHAVDKIAAAIAEFGFRVPLLIQRNYVLIDGHLRLKAAQKLGMTNVPCIFVDDLSDAKIKALRLSVNKMAELAEWDEGLLALELQELREMDFNIDVIGFDLNGTDSVNLNTDVPEMETQNIKMVQCPSCNHNFAL